MKKYAVAGFGLLLWLASLAHVVWSLATGFVVTRNDVAAFDREPTQFVIQFGVSLVIALLGSLFVALWLREKRRRLRQSRTSVSDEAASPKRLGSVIGKSLEDAEGTADK